MHRFQPPAQTWGAHVSLRPAAASALLPFKPPQQKVPSAPSLRARLVNAEPLAALALRYGSCLLPITPASGLRGEEIRGSPLAPLRKEGTHSPQHPIYFPPQPWGGGPRILPVRTPHPRRSRLFGAHPAPPVAPQHPALLHLPPRVPAETRSPRRAPRGARPPAHPHDAGSFPPPGRAPTSPLALPGSTGSGFKARAGAGR